MNYTVGTKVTIRTDLEAKIYDEDVKISAVSNMLQYRGKVATITRVNHNHNGTWYCLDIDENFWNWTAKMFEASMAPIIPGTIVKCANGNTYYVHNKERAFSEVGTLSLEKKDLIGSWEIVAVYEVTKVVNLKYMLSSIEEKGKLIWEKKTKTKEMTVKEISDALGYEVKIIKEDF